MAKKMKTVRIVKVDEIIQVNGGFFRIERQEVDSGMGRGVYDRYFLKTIKSPKVMKDFLKYVKEVENE